MSEPGRSENEAIARRAYEIWEAEGRPHGRDREHWEAAAKELGSPAPMPSGYTDAEGLTAPGGTSGKPAARRKKADPAPGAEPTAATKPARRKGATPAI